MEDCSPRGCGKASCSTPTIEPGAVSRIIIEWCAQRALQMAITSAAQPRAHPWFGHLLSSVRGGTAPICALDSLSEARFCAASMLCGTSWPQSSVLQPLGRVWTSYELISSGGPQAAARAGSTDSPLFQRRIERGRVLSHAGLRLCAHPKRCMLRRSGAVMSLPLELSKSWGGGAVFGARASPRGGLASDASCIRLWNGVLHRTPGRFTTRGYARMVSRGHSRSCPTVHLGAKGGDGRSGGRNIGRECSAETRTAG